jgi:aminoglycoside N3'-acetyltransferase
MITVTKAHIEECLVNLGLGGKVVEVHSSLSSFGNIIGGAGSVVNALLKICDTILMTSYNYKMQLIRPPENDRPQQNGVNYNYFKPQGWKQKLLARMGLPYPMIWHCQTEGLLERVIFRTKNLSASCMMLSHLLNGLARLPSMQYIKNLTMTPFDLNSFGNDSFINDDMGIIAKTLMNTQGTIRSKHPSVSWAANGTRAKYYIIPHPPDDPLLPLRKLYEDNGYAVLLGVSLSKCTALHLSEELVGRRTFIRWVLYNDGVIRRVRQSGCIGGAINLESTFERFAKRTQIGMCKAVAYPIRDIVDTGAIIIRRSPEITLCTGGKGCEECIDAAKGGPIE